MQRWWLRMKENLPRHFCCEQLQRYFEDPRMGFVYSRTDRAYYMHARENATFLQTIHYCPFCGNKFPENLRILRNDLIDALDLDMDNLPEKFKTDTWWLENRYLNKGLFNI